MKFNKGDLVVLKSGGPTMTVKDGDGHSEVQCQWFSGKKLEQGWFSVESLEAPKETDT
jgi:uncharacterized protein YodC (DUF2158 family)